MTMKELTRILDRKDAQYFIIGDIMYVADECWDGYLGYLRIRFDDGKYASHRPWYDTRYEDLNKKGAQWDCSHHENVLHTGLPVRTSHNIQSLLDAIDR